MGQAAEKFAKDTAKVVCTALLTPLALILGPNHSLFGPNGPSAQQRRQYEACEQRMEAERRKFDALEAEYQRKMEDIQERMEKADERERARLEMMQKNEVDDYEANQEKMYEEHLKSVAALPDPPKTDNPSLCVIGRTGAGKSSLINKIFGANCEVDDIVCTKGINLAFNAKFRNTHLEVYDVFGANDQETYSEVNKLLALKKIHIIFVVYTDDVTNILKLARLVSALKVPAVFVRNKMDKLDTYSEEKKNIILQTELGHLRKINSNFRLVMGSTEKGHGMEELANMVL